jgi:hypothetical protein
METVSASKAEMRSGIIMNPPLKMNCKLPQNSLMLKPEKMRAGPMLVSTPPSR